MKFDPVETQRLLIRSAEPGDAEGLHDRRNDSEVARYQNWSLPFPMDRAETIVASSNRMGGPEPDEWWMATVALPSGESIGDLAVHLKWEGREAEVGYTFSPTHWGHGYATESAGALVAWLFGEAGVNRLSAMTHPENIASAMVLERLGLKFEGHTRQSYWVGGEPSDDWIFGLTRDDWETWTNRPTGRPDEVRLVEITPETVSDVSRLHTHKTQERFVATVAQSFGDALFPEEWDGAAARPWMRAVVADGDLAGFVMLDVTYEGGHDEPYLWRLLVDRMHQRRGIGRAVLDLVVEQCRAWGDVSLRTSWGQGRGSPEPFYLSYGFEPTGVILDGEIEGRLTIPR